MRTATGLTLVAIGAILAFAIRTSPSFLDLQVAGWVIMLTGVAGMFIPRRGSGGLRRRIVVRRPRGFAGDPQRQPMAAVYGTSPPWHDVQAMVQGPAVGDVEAVFRERWADPAPPTRNPVRRLRDLLAGVEDARRLPPQLPDPPPATPDPPVFGRRRNGELGIVQHLERK